MFTDFITFISADNLINKILKVAIIIVVSILFKKIVNRIFDSKIESKFIDERYKFKAKTVISLFQSFFNVVVYFLAITFILNVFGINTSSIIAVAGVGGMAVAFASKSLIEDVISGAILLFENQYNIGDSVTIGSITGKVKNVGMRVTTLEDIDGREIIIPNGQINVVINNSINNMRASVSVYISDNKPYELVELALNRACETVYMENNLGEKPNILGIENLDVEGYQVTIAVMVSNGNQWDIQRKLRKEIVRELQKDNISFARLLKD